MQSRHQRLLVELVLLGTSLLTLATGLVLLLGFHVGQGAWATSALGLSRLAWLDLHRFGALAAGVALVWHLVQRKKGLLARLRAAVHRRRWRRSATESVLYLVTTVVVATGLAAWFVVEGSAPVLGPVTPGPLEGGRHTLVDVHDITGILAAILTIHHTAHRWGRMVRVLRQWLGPMGGAGQPDRAG